MSKLKSIAVFCGASIGKSQNFISLAKNLGETLAKEEITLVYGGSNTGIMQVLADSVLNNKGRVIGVIPKSMYERQVAHKKLDQLIVVDNMHQRKAKMIELATGFIAMPGGFGTLDELCEVITWAQLGIHKHPIALLNCDNYFNLFVDFYQQAASAGFIDSGQAEAIIVSDSVSELIKAMENWSGMPLKKSANLG